ncbi:hypothetical protein P170DRAFT_464040 [Aspergillus steynii IBT 23096]|uniref:AAA+ ATPase lid domain-containing protein n=1 Tax=Aspergillus steynii IBT 23096 TaxID=1392250 RepID=A0A2I2GDS6_9EURO|nr:uncharacterized protein P170DRAFT_464040 [Aspergillus steynii IBT 23096]PLB51023.1 hypothetical protein P170DRAFT_464040 [Aspergillus steynii IBT 23096]
MSSLFQIPYLRVPCSILTSQFPDSRHITISEDRTAESDFSNKQLAVLKPASQPRARKEEEAQETPSDPRPDGAILSSEPTRLNSNVLPNGNHSDQEKFKMQMILTSNRVGTFDEAFKSRIQLSLHYPNLTSPQRRKIWVNLVKRLKRLNQPNTDFDDIECYIPELAEKVMNGRQIRNALTTARQLAEFKKRDMIHSDLKHVIEVAFPPAVGPSSKESIVNNTSVAGSIMLFLSLSLPSEPLAS